MKPIEFTTSIQKIIAECGDDAEPQNRDTEQFHSRTDTLMEEQLIELGYGKGIKRIRSQRRWYA
jgi:hypothetical protein